MKKSLQFQSLRAKSPGANAALSWFLRCALVVALVVAAYCGNTFVTAGCLRECDEQHDACLLTGALYSTTPDGARSDFWSLLFLGCQSALYVCEDSCGGASGRL